MLHGPPVAERAWGPSGRQVPGKLTKPFQLEKPAFQRTYSGCFWLNILTCYRVLVKFLLLLAAA